MSRSPTVPKNHFVRRMFPPVLGKNSCMSEGEVVEDNAYLGAGEAARILEVSPKTVSRWADKGLIPCVTTLGGHRRFRRSTVEQIWRDMYGPTAAHTEESR